MDAETQERERMPCICEFLETSTIGYIYIPSSPITIQPGGELLNIARFRPEATCSRVFANDTIIFYFQKSNLNEYVFLAIIALTALASAPYIIAPTSSPLDPNAPI